MKNTFRYILIIVTFLLVLACKKKDEDTTLPSIAGISLNDPIPFVRVGASQTFKVDLTSLYTSDYTDPGTMGMYWQVNGGDRDTTTRDISKSNPSYVVTTEKTGNYSVIASVYAINGKYYAGAVSLAFQAIDPATALSESREGTKTEIDGKPYLVTEVGGKTWMGMNLYGTETGKDYRDCEVVSALFGRYYNWYEAQTACPDGWHLPTGKEFDESLGSQAGDLMVDIKFLSVDMWTYWPQVPITNKLKFNAMPTGYIDMTTTQEVFGYKEFACWWTADTNAEDNELGDFRYIQQEEPLVMKGKGSKESLRLNVRCIKNAD